jgi:hypothetical protein
MSMHSLFFCLNHPVKNSLNFRHPSKGGGFFRLQLGYWSEL